MALAETHSSHKTNVNSPCKIHIVAFRAPTLSNHRRTSANQVIDNAIFITPIKIGSFKVRCCHRCIVDNPATGRRCHHVRFSRKNLDHILVPLKSSAPTPIAKAISDESRLVCIHHNIIESFRMRERTPCMRANF